MKSGKQRRFEIKERRLVRARGEIVMTGYVMQDRLPDGAVLADAAALAHNNTYSLLPLFYLGRPFACRDCAVDEVWTAKQQKWWYETAKGYIHSKAVRCRSCRAALQRNADASRQASADRHTKHVEGMPPPQLAAE